MIRKSELLFIFISALVIASASEYNVDKSKNNLVKFISDAPIEDFEGVTDNIDGYVYLPDISNPSESELYFEVDLNTIDTGIGLRNRHMREDYLHTDKYRYTTYSGKFSEITKKDENNYDVAVSGEIFIHGVTKPLDVKGKMVKMGDVYKISTEFEVKLTDYNIEVPSFMFLKIDEVMQLILEFYIKPAQS